MEVVIVRRVEKRVCGVALPGPLFQASVTNTMRTL